MALPEPYATWFEAVVGAPPPEVAAAPCHACPRCDDAGYHPSVKCCTYAPSMTHVMVGRALRDGGEAAEVLRRRLTEGRVTATWLHPSEEEEAAYDAHRDRFGATDGVRCPYVSDEGSCRVWAYRNAICATWFCRHDGDALGAAMWDAAAELLHFAEGGLAVLVADDAGRRDEAAMRAAADRADAVCWDDLRRLGGAELREREVALVQAWAAWRAWAEGQAQEP